MFFPSHPFLKSMLNVVIIDATLIINKRLLIYGRDLGRGKKYF